MKKNLLSIILVIIFIFSIFSTIFLYNTLKNTTSKTNEIFILAYCPTMEEEAKQIALNNKNIELIKYQSTMEVLNNLNNNKIDIGLVGRIAKTNELKDNYNEIRLKDGLTLINFNKQFIQYSELKNLKIYTNLDNKTVKEFMGNLENIVFIDNLTISIETNQNYIYLINWKDYDDNYELLIPINEKNEKIKKFRIPVLYSYKNLSNLKII